MQNGMDVTEEMFSAVAKKAIAERIRTGDFADTVAYLNAAKSSLERLPTPWMNDCIFDSIVAIDKLIVGLAQTNGGL